MEDLHVLLMLSTKQPPDPIIEVEWHDRMTKELSDEKSPTFIATTRLIKGLRPGVSEVHFYGDSQLDNAYLGSGIFHSYILLTSPKGQELMNELEVYRNYGCPANTRGFIGVTKFENVVGMSIDDLNGVMRSNRTPLSLQNLPNSAARAQIYFYKLNR